MISTEQVAVALGLIAPAVAARAEDAAGLVRAIHVIAPEALLVVYTHDRLADVTFSDRRMLVQSAVRLRGDLAAIAEMRPAR